MVKKRPPKINVNYKLDPKDQADLYKVAAELGTSVTSLLRMLTIQRLEKVRKDTWNPQNFFPKE